MKEATNSITRADAPHSAIAKLRRDMDFNIMCLWTKEDHLLFSVQLRFLSFGITMVQEPP
jgi:hypothetical protein